MSDHLLELDVAWQQHVSPERPLFDALMARHREKHRRYHTAVHVLHVVRHVRELSEVESVDDLDAVVAAALYHDAVHEPASPANERASARLARRDLTELGWNTERCDRVGVMIEGTKEHREPVDLDAAVLFDADLAILGSEPARYDDYVTGVRAEYRHVDDTDWRYGRAGVLTEFIERTSIFATGEGRRRWEERARANLASELAALTSGD